MQSQMIGMQSSLDRILTAVQPQPQSNALSKDMESSPRRDGSSYAVPSSGARNGFESSNGDDRSRAFPPLPGFAPPVCRVPTQTNRITSCLTNHSHTSMHPMELLPVQLLLQTMNPRIRYPEQLLMLQLKLCKA